MREIGRHQGRCLALQLLYQNDFNKMHQQDIYEQLREEYPQLDRDSFTWSLVKGVLDNQEQLDSIIQKKAQHWKLSRISYVDRNILRLTLYQLLYLPDIPSSVAINEAVELGKEFGGENSSTFINGLLGGFLRDEP